MLVNKFDIYESWNLEKPNIPVQSRLYQLEPIGVGTPYVESLTGYITRLAETHSVPTDVLVLKEIAPLFKEGKYDNLSGIFGGNSTKALNGMGQWVIELIHSLESLTLLNDFKALTMVTWAEVIPTRNLLNPVRAWCPICYENWFTDKHTIYEPLLWSLKEVKICLHHNQYLCTKCPHCKQENKLLTAKSRPGYCSKCLSWLGFSQSNVSSEFLTLKQSDIDWQHWVIKNLGDLIAYALNVSPPPKEKIRETLSTYVNIMTDGNRSAFAKYIGKECSQTHDWCLGRYTPTIDTLLQICFELKTSLLDFLTKEVSITDIDKLSIVKEKQPNKKTITSYKKCNTATVILHTLNIALTENPPPSLIELAERLGYKRFTTLYHYYPDLCRAISDRHTKYRKAEREDKQKLILEEMLKNEESPPPSMRIVSARMGINGSDLKRRFPELYSAILLRYNIYRQEESKKRLEKITEEIRVVAKKLDSEGIEPTCRRISMHSSMPMLHLQKKAVEIVKQIRQELGWEN